MFCNFDGPSFSVNQLKSILLFNGCLCLFQLNMIICDYHVSFDFYRAMLCIRGTSHGPVSVCVCVCVRMSQVGVLLKRLNTGSHKQHHTIAQ